MYEKKRHLQMANKDMEEINDVVFFGYGIIKEFINKFQDQN